jgi:hypothetical protein
VAGFGPERRITLWERFVQRFTTGDTTAGVLCRVRVGAPRPVREINPDVPEWFGGLIGQLQAMEAASSLPSAFRKMGRSLLVLQQG